MSEVVATREIDWAPTADTALKAAAGFWFLVTVIGQWVFVAFKILHDTFSESAHCSTIATTF